MPIYQYQCTACHYEMEALQKMSDPRLTVCPHCEKSTLQKQLTAAAFKLKGTGWYETDFKNSGKKPVAEKADKSQDSSASTAATGKSSSNSSSKPVTSAG